jgi:hypothetical protein
MTVHIWVDPEDLACGKGIFDRVIVLDVPQPWHHSRDRCAGVGVAAPFQGSTEGRIRRGVESGIHSASRLAVNEEMKHTSPLDTPDSTER